MITGLALLVVGVVALWAGAEGLVRGASRLGTRYGLSPVLVGMTVVSLGTSLPELVVCLLAAARGSPDLVMGNVLGSNMANVGLVLGLTALVRPMRVAAALRRRDVPAVVGVTLVVLPLLLGGVVGRLDAALLLALLAGYLTLLVRSVRERGSPAGEDPMVPAEGPRGEVSGGASSPGSLEGAASDEEAGVHGPSGAGRPPGRAWKARQGPAAGRSLALVAVGSLLLLGGAHGIVEGALILAAELGLPEVVVGLSAVAVGTSLPELATTVVAALKGRSALAMGNIVGSNVFNLTAVLGGTAVVFPVSVSEGIVVGEYAVTLALTLLLVPLVLTRRRVTRWEGVVLLAAYGLAWAWVLHV